MPRGLLLVSLALPGTTVDKRPYQAAVGENIRSCRYYVQILEDTWGPPERNFERDYTLALRCLDDPAMPMQDVAVFFKKPLVPHQEDPRVKEFREQRRSEGRLLEIDSPEQFRRSAGRSSFRLAGDSGAGRSRQRLICPFICVRPVPADKVFLDRLIYENLYEQLYAWTWDPAVPSLSSRSRSTGSAPPMLPVFRMRTMESSCWTTALSAGYWSIARSRNTISSISS